MNRTRELIGASLRPDGAVVTHRSTAVYETIREIRVAETASGDIDVSIGVGDGHSLIPGSPHIEISPDQADHLAELLTVLATKLRARS